MNHCQVKMKIIVIYNTLIIFKLPFLYLNGIFFRPLISTSRKLGGSAEHHLGNTGLSEMLLLVQLSFSELANLFPVPSYEISYIYRIKYDWYLLQ
jgi:hypothetical protein